MPSIERYTKGIVRERAVARLDNPNAVQYAGGTARSVAGATSQLADLSEKLLVAHEETAVAKAIIDSKRQKIDYLTKAREENNSNPYEFEKRAEAGLLEIDDRFAKSLPTGRAKESYMRDAQEANLSAYEQNTKWSISRQTDIAVDRVKDVLEQGQHLAFESGRSGGDIRAVGADIDKAIAASSRWIDSEKLDNLKRSSDAAVYKNYIQGMISTEDELQASKAIELIDGKWGRNLSPDDRSTLVKQAKNVLDAAELKRERAEIKRLTANQKTQEYILEGKSLDAYENFVQNNPQAVAGKDINDPQFIIDTQRSIGVNEGDLQVINDNQASFIARRFKEAQNMDQARAVLQETIGAFKTPELQEIATRNLIDSDELSPSIRAIIANPSYNQYGDMLGAGLLKDAQNTEAVTKANQFLKDVVASGDINKTDIDKLVAAGLGKLNEITEYHLASGQSEFMTDVFPAMRSAVTIAIADLVATNGKHAKPKDVEKMFDAFGDFSYEHGFPVKKDLAENLSQTAIRNSLSDKISNLPDLAIKVIDDNGKIRYMERKDSPKEYDVYKNQLIKSARLRYSGKVGSEEVYTVIDVFGSEVMRSNGEPLYVGERDLIQGIKKAEEGRENQMKLRPVLSTPERSTEERRWWVEN